MYIKSEFLPIRGGNVNVKFYAAFSLRKYKSDFRHIIEVKFNNPIEIAPSECLRRGAGGFYTLFSPPLDVRNRI